MKNIFKIILSNWINIVLILIAVYAYAFIIAYSGRTFDFNDSIFSATYLIFLYGMLFWAGFIVSILILDVIMFAFNKAPQYTTVKLIVEWIIISAPFIYWLIEYSEWTFLIAVLAFLLGQYLRRAYIIKMLVKDVSAGRPI